MNILIVHNGKIPATKYGGTERVIWDLARELVKSGHKIGFLVKKGSFCDFGEIYDYDINKPVDEQIPIKFDVIHFNSINRSEKKPYIITLHGNSGKISKLDKNCVFVSKNHAARHGSDSFVYNGLDWDNYEKPDLKKERTYYHYLANAAWRVKNVKGAIDIIKKSDNEKLYVMGGKRLNIKMGFRFTMSNKIKFFGMVNNDKKFEIMSNSKGLIFPVRWHEPFGLAIIESLFSGCPVFGTPYGSLPELVKKEFGFLSTNEIDFIDVLKNGNNFSRKDCHEYALDNFNSKIMAEKYLEKYTKVLNGEVLNEKNPQLLELSDKFLPWN